MPESLSTDGGELFAALVIWNEMAAAVLIRNHLIAYTRFCLTLRSKGNNS